MNDFLGFFAVQITLIAVVLVLHTYLGLHVIRRTLIFSDLVLDQLAAFGAMVGIGLGIGYGTSGSYWLSLGAVILGSLLLAVAVPRDKRIPREAVIGILYAMALVISLLLGDKLSGGGDMVTKTLAGAMLWVSWPLVIVTVAVYILLAIFHFVFRDRFIALADPDSRLQQRRKWDFLFFTTQGIITVLIVPIAGVLLAYAFLMIPAAIATMFVRGWLKAVAVGWSIGMASCLVGLTASYHWNLPYGPSLVLAMGASFIIAVIIRSLRPGARSIPEGSLS